MQTVGIQLMGGGVVRRTQVYLGDEELALLDRAVCATGASRSELIRRAVRRQTYGTMSTANRSCKRSRSYRRFAWSDYAKYTGAQYVDATRGDLNERLRKLGLE